MTIIPKAIVDPMKVEVVITIRVLSNRYLSSTDATIIPNLKQLNNCVTFFKVKPRLEATSIQRDILKALPLEKVRVNQRAVTQKVKMMVDTTRETTDLF